MKLIGVIFLIDFLDWLYYGKVVLVVCSRVENVINEIVCLIFALGCLQKYRHHLGICFLASIRPFRTYFYKSIKNAMSVI